MDKRRLTRIKMFEDIDVYPVTCEKLSDGRSDIDVLEGVIQGGAKIIQLREKELEKRDVYLLALKFREMTTEAGVLLIINDYLDIALAVDADGVHLGQDDLPVDAARELAPQLIIGASTHSTEEAAEAEKQGADYINIGPIFPTKTKEKVGKFLGPEGIPAIRPSVSVPFTVMGGINGSNIDRVVEQGARRIAMVTAITKAPDIAEAVRDLRKRIPQDDGSIR